MLEGPRMVNVSPAFDPEDEVRTTELIKETVELVKELVGVEVTLARDEWRKELTRLVGTIIAFSVGAAGLVLGAAALLVALGVATSALVALTVGLALIVAGAAAAALGYARLPKRPMDETLRRLKTDEVLLRQRFAARTGLSHPASGGEHAARSPSTVVTTWQGPSPHEAQLTPNK